MNGLRNFLGTRTMKGEMYPSGSLHTIKYGLDRAVQEFGHNFDITDKKSVSLQAQTKDFEIAQKELKFTGKGHKKSTPEISPACKFSNIVLKKKSIDYNYKQVSIKSFKK